MSVSWEFIFRLFFPHRSIQRTIDVVWFCLTQCHSTSKIWLDQFPRLSKLAFYITFILTLITSFCTVLFVDRISWLAGSLCSLGKTYWCQFCSSRCSINFPVIAEICWDCSLQVLGRCSPPRLLFLCRYLSRFYFSPLLLRCHFRIHLIYVSLLFTQQRSR